ARVDVVGVERQRRRLVAGEREDVRGLPRPERGAVVEDGDLLGAVRDVLALVRRRHDLRDVLVDAGNERVDGELGRVVGREAGVDGPTLAREAGDAGALVAVEEARHDRAGELREPPEHAATDELHLREPVARHEVALDADDVVQGLAVDVRRAARVAHDVDRRAQAGDRHRLVDGQARDAPGVWRAGVDRGSAAAAAAGCGRARADPDDPPVPWVHREPPREVCPVRGHHVTMEPTPGASTYVKPDDLDWKPTQLEGISIKVLYEDPAKGEMTCLLRWAPGARLPMHRHPEIEQ